MRHSRYVFSTALSTHLLADGRHSVRFARVVTELPNSVSGMILNKEIALLSTVISINYYLLTPHPMDDISITQLATLWFVVLIFIQTGSGGGSAVNMAIESVSILLMYILPLTLFILIVLRLTDN